MKEVDCSSNTTEAEPSGGGGGVPLIFGRIGPLIPMTSLCLGGCMKR